ncbi:MAG: endonuclease/exonuclease/phosphatase family protein [Pseudomonadota bacterium]
MLRDILKGESQDISGTADVIAHVAPDVVLLVGFDFDLNGVALAAFAETVAGRGQSYPYRHAWPSNRGRASFQDLDQDGYLGDPEDAHGYGLFAGQGSMALLSRFPLDPDAGQDWHRFLWGDLPGAIPPDDAARDDRLASTGFWEVPVRPPNGPSFHVLAWHASPPVFDGPEDRNGRRNHDEAAFWLSRLDGRVGTPIKELFVLLGDSNLDTADGDGRPGAMSDLLSHPALLDPQPTSAGGIEAAERELGANLRHTGDPALDTVNWPDDGTWPGNLRVDYVLPSAGWDVVGSGVFWPERGDPLRALIGDEGDRASRHHLVWVDLVPSSAAQGDVDGR